MTSADALLHRIEALPGEGRFAITFRRPDGGEQTAVAQLHESNGDVHVAESSLPPGWVLDSDVTRSVLAAVTALDTARRLGSAGAASLRDVEGGWDVGLGNVVLGADGTPRCTAHDVLVEAGGVWTCPECGAQAVLA